MESKAGEPHARRGVVKEEEAIGLVVPLLTFLQASGMSQEGAERVFKRSWAKAQRIKTSIAVCSLRNMSEYVEIISIWNKDPDFTDRQGLPRELKYRGKNGFSGLVQRASRTLKVTEALAVLTKFGNVEETHSHNLKLVRPFFHVRSADNLAFEPSARFLSDASATVRHLLNGSRNSKGTPRLFWRTADTMELPESAIPAYIAFAKSRSLVFLQEVDDWLQSHVDPKQGAGGRRVGLGLFSICERTAST